MDDHGEFRQPEFRQALWLASEGYVSRSVWRITLFELVALVTFCAMAISMCLEINISMGVCLLLTVVSFRTAIIDFTFVGAFATLMTVVFGTSGVALFITWSAGW